MDVDPTVREHLHHAGQSVKNAARTAADDFGQRVLPDSVRGHLRSAARHVLQAGLAAIDAREAKAKPSTSRELSVSVIQMPPGEAAPPTAG